MSVSPVPEDLRGDPWLGADPSNPEYRENPAPFLRRLREIAPVNVTPLGTWRLARYDDCIRLLKEVRSGVRFEDGTPALGARSNVAAGPGEFMLQQDPPESHPAAAARQQGVHAARGRAASRARARQRARAPRRGARSADEMDVIADLALPVPSTVICEMMGVPLADRARFTEWTGDADAPARRGVRAARTSWSAASPRPASSRSTSSS